MVRWDIELSRMEGYRQWLGGTLNCHGWRDTGGIQTMVRWDIELSRMEGYRQWLGGTLNCHGWRDTDNG